MPVTPCLKASSVRVHDTSTARRKEAFKSKGYSGVDTFKVAQTHPLCKKMEKERTFRLAYSGLKVDEYLTAIRNDHYFFI